MFGRVPHVRKISEMLKMLLKFDKKCDDVKTNAANPGKNVNPMWCHMLQPFNPVFNNYELVCTCVCLCNAEKSDGSETKIRIKGPDNPTTQSLPKIRNCKAGSVSFQTKRGLDVHMSKLLLKQQSPGHHTHSTAHAFCM